MYTSHELARIAADAARQVGPYLIEAFSRPRTVELKADFHDVVTVHDKESQRRIADFLFAETPESFIVGEESSRMLTCDGRPGTPGEGDVVWYVDPIDGTSNFASGFDHWCVSIAAARGGALTAGVVYQPTTNTLYLADDAGALRNGQPMRVLDAPVEDGMIATEFPSARVPDPEAAAGSREWSPRRGRCGARGRPRSPWPKSPPGISWPPSTLGPIPGTSPRGPCWSNARAGATSASTTPRSTAATRRTPPISWRRGAGRPPSSPCRPWAARTRRP